MALISPADQETLRHELASVTRRVRLLFFTQTFDCSTCLQARQIVDEFPLLSDAVSVEEVNLVLDSDRARLYGVDRTPAIVVLFEEWPPAASVDQTVWRDSNIRFLGLPAGYEFVALVQAVLLVGAGKSRLSAASQQRLAAVDRPVEIRVFSTPTCPHCPSAIVLAFEMAFANPHVKAYGIEVTEFPDLARRYAVTGVPKTVVDDRVEILGALPEQAFVEQALVEIAGGVAAADSGGPAPV
jgi:glutaredoxin-like protein